VLLDEDPWLLADEDLLVEVPEEPDAPEVALFVLDVPVADVRAPEALDPREALELPLGALEDVPFAADPPLDPHPVATIAAVARMIAVVFIPSSSSRAISLDEFVHLPRKRVTFTGTACEPRGVRATFAQGRAKVVTDGGSIGRRRSSLGRSRTMFVHC
jgi:hypothetical protein